MKDKTLGLDPSKLLGFKLIEQSISSLPGKQGTLKLGAKAGTKFGNKGQP
ncbi:MAG: hypothetical protein V7744_20030 [Pseudomonadales bacterium]